jgi:homoserine trans-succinylase
LEEKRRMEGVYRKIVSYLRFDELKGFKEKLSNVSAPYSIVNKIYIKQNEKGMKILKFMKELHVRSVFTNSKECDYVLEYLSYTNPLSLRIKRDLYAQHYLFHYPLPYAENWYNGYPGWKNNILNQYKRDVESDFHKFKLYHLQKQMTFDEIGAIGY